MLDVLDDVISFRQLSISFATFCRLHSTTPSFSHPAFISAKFKQNAEANAGIDFVK